MMFQDNDKKLPMLEEHNMLIGLTQHWLVKKLIKRERIFPVFICVTNARLTELKLKPHYKLVLV